MKFEEILPYLREKKSAKRKDWIYAIEVGKLGNLVFVGSDHENYDPDPEDLFCDDWELAKEENLIDEKFIKFMTSSLFLTDKNTVNLQGRNVKLDPVSTQLLAKETVEKFNKYFKDRSENEKIKIPFEWKWLNEYSTFESYRAKVFGGWLVNNITRNQESGITVSESMAFVSDPNHLWEV